MTEVQGFPMFPLFVNPYQLAAFTLHGVLEMCFTAGEEVIRATAELAVDFFRSADNAHRQGIMDNEVRLQIELARVHPSELENEDRVALRLERNSAALRPFLAHHQGLTIFSGHLLVSLVERAAAARFVVNFHYLEHELRRRLGISLDRWKQGGGGRNALSNLLCDDYTLFQRASNWHIWSTCAKEGLAQDCLTALCLDDYAVA